MCWLPHPPTEGGPAPGLTPLQRQRDAERRGEEEEDEEEEVVAVERERERKSTEEGMCVSGGQKEYSTLAYLAIYNRIKNTRKSSFKYMFYILFTWKS